MKRRIREAGRIKPDDRCIRSQATDRKKRPAGEGGSEGAWKIRRAGLELGRERELYVPQIGEVAVGAVAV